MIFNLNKCTCPVVQIGRIDVEIEVWPLKCPPLPIFFLSLFFISVFERGPRRTDFDVISLSCEFKKKRI